MCIRDSFKGGDGGANVCGGLGPLLGYLSCSPYFSAWDLEEDEDKPVSYTHLITHLLNHKSGINFASYAHTGLPVPVFAQGVGHDRFKGYYDNTDIYKKIAALLTIE